MRTRDWLQLARAQTAPATILLILTPYLTNASLSSPETLAIGLFALLAHWISFGHNSLMDTAMGYDLKDPSKKHHPLVAGRIRLTAAHNVIHWGLCGLSIAAVIMSMRLSPCPTLALVSIFLWYVFGYAYNSGLSKETLLSFLPISICFTAMGAWGWFLSHETLNNLGWLYLAYIFLTITFQTSWSGHLKELGIKERSNILLRMGARIYNQAFIPRKAWIYGWVVKSLNLTVGGLLLMENFSLATLAWYMIISGLAVKYLYKLTKSRIYIREKELLNMSLEEVLTIYLPIPLLLPWVEGIILMVMGVAYFFAMNFWLWRAPHPAV